MWAAAVATAVAALVQAGTAGMGGAAARSNQIRARVWYVVDGDTVRLASGRYVRFVQIDAPELHPAECYGRRASELLHSWIAPGSRVTLQADPRLDRVDRYGRLLRYVFSGTRNLNLALVSRGAATVWFYNRDRGRYAARLLSGARHARANGRGLWGACRAVWDPYGPATTHYKHHRR